MIMLKKNFRKSMWSGLLAQSITTLNELEKTLHVNEPGLKEVVSRYPMRINPYYLGLIKNKGDAIYKQCVPNIKEMMDETGFEDPLNEEELSPVQGLTHRYPDRVLFLVSSKCAMYCRFCNRKRKVGHSKMVSSKSIQEGIKYIRAHREIRDVLLSGGDPLLLSNHEIDQILRELREISHIQIIRIGSRVPCTLPQRITPQLVKILAQYHPLYINTHFNHPDEITPQSTLACAMLANAGIPLGCQTVLLKGINDDPKIIKSLMQKLLTIRVRPYYLFQADLARGTSHFWTPLRQGIKIMERLQGHTSGICVPHFAIDLPGGGGKVPLLPAYVTGIKNNHLLLRNYKGIIYKYPL